jgi:hypothetical protein
MNAMDQVPAAQLKKLLEDEEVLAGLPINLRQQVSRRQLERVWVGGGHGWYFKVEWKEDGGVGTKMSDQG